jgi:ribosome-binding protein aMBF1 (putative translation factor)
MTEITLDQAKKELMKNKEFKKLYDEKSPMYDFIYEMVRVRSEKGMTQAELAKRMETTQTVISRLESGKQIPNLTTIAKFAEATQTRPVINFVDM